MHARAHQWIREVRDAGEAGWFLGCSCQMKQGRRNVAMGHTVANVDYFIKIRKLQMGSCAGRFFFNYTAVGKREFGFYLFFD